MAVGYPTRENPYYFEADSNVFAGEIPLSTGGGLKVDGVAIAAVILLLFLGFQLIRDRSRGIEQVAAPVSITSAETGEQNKVDPSQTDPMAKDVGLIPAPVPSSSAIAYPYDEYWLTQGPHGYSYGHAAIDLAAGKGVSIKSPINGTVIGNYIDQYGNTTLIIENERYQVTLLHGNYNAAVNQVITLGEIIGSEGNNGYTTDMYGNSCRGRDCGYHTHLNVYDLTLGQNVNPLDVLGL